MFVFFVYVCFVFGTLMVIRLLNVDSCEICAVEEVARLAVAGYFQNSISSFFFSNFVYFLILISSFSLFKHYHRLLTLCSVGVFPYYFLLQVEFARNFVFPMEMGFVASNTISVQKRPLP